MPLLLTMTTSTHAHAHAEIERDGVRETERDGIAKWPNGQAISSDCHRVGEVKCKSTPASGNNNNNIRVV